jgi:acyl dehydratase
MEFRELAEMPSMGRQFAKALLPSFHRGPARIPQHGVRVSGLAQDAARLAAYDRVCGFTVRDRVPPTWLHVLTFPLHVALLSDPSSTVRLAGVVHVSNRMRLHRPVTAAERLDVSVRVANLRRHQRGALLDLVGEIHVDGELVWDGVSTYLAPGAEVPGESVSVPKPAFAPSEPIARWRLPADLGRQYRAVSGDPNPIHTNALAARAFGFARPIIHGMWTHARLLAGFEPRLPDSYAAQVSFTKPILLPGVVGAWWRPDGDGWLAAATTTDGAKPYLVLQVEP